MTLRVFEAFAGTCSITRALGGIGYAAQEN